MGIKVSKKGPHGAAAEEITEVSKTEHKDGESEIVDHEYESKPVVLPQMEIIEVGTSFKMPVAQYTMLEFSVKRTMPFNPEEKSADEVFDTLKDWVESKLNAMIEDQQNEE